MKNSNKLLNGFIVFVIITSSLAVVLYFNVPGQIERYYYKDNFKPIQNGEQTKDETADWLTYENEKYGYRVKYPKDWEFKKLVEYEKIEMEKRLEETNSIGNHDYGFVIFETIRKERNISLENWIEKKYPVAKIQKLESEKNIIVDSHSGIHRNIINFSSGGYENDAFLILSDDKVLKINMNIYIANSEIQNEYKRILSYILNSLKFVGYKNDRILLTLENIQQYNPPEKPICNEEFNRDNPNTTVKYENKKNGISFEIPYNSNWGNWKYKINPYEKWSNESGKEYVLFGHITDFEACSWVRSYSLYFNPVKSADMLVEEMEKIPYYPEIFIVKPTKKSINGLDIVESQSHGLCDSGELEIVGEKYNYVIKPLCGADFEFLESIVKSIKLIE